MRGIRMAIVYLQQRNVAVASPEDQTGLLTVGIDCQCVSNYGRASPGIRLEIQTGTPTVALPVDAQFFDWAKSIGCDISHSRVIKQPPNYRRFIWGDGPIQNVKSPVSIMSRNEAVADEIRRSRTMDRTGPP